MEKKLLLAVSLVVSSMVSSKEVNYTELSILWDLRQQVPTGRGYPARVPKTSVVWSCYSKYELDNPAGSIRAQPE